jgi:hypothetical protein
VHLRNSLLGTEAVVGFSLGDKLLRIAPILVESLGLNIGANAASDIRSLIPVKAQPAEGFVEILDILLGVACPVGIFEPENEGATD